MANHLVLFNVIFTSPVNEYATREDRMDSVFSESIFSHKYLFLCIV